MSNTPTAAKSYRWVMPCAVVAVSAVMIGIMLLIHVTMDEPIGNLTRDPNTVGHQSLYVGFLSQLGIFMWSATVAVCWFAARLVSRWGDGKQQARFFYVSGALTLMLGMDDAFLLHEAFFPKFGIPETVVFACYGGLVFFYLAIYRRTILRTHYELLLMAFFCFSISVALDAVPLPGIDPYLFEDGAKFIGIVSWLAYFSGVSIEFATREHGARTT